MEGTIGQSIQDAFLYFAISDTVFLKAVRHQLDLAFFDNEITRDCVRICWDFYDRHGEAPQEHFLDEVNSRLSTSLEEEDRKVYGNYVVKVSKAIQTGLTRKYVLGKVSDWIKENAYKRIIIESSELWKSGRLDEVEEKFSEALKSGLKEVVMGLDYFDDFSYLYRRSDTSDILMTTGIKTLDRYIRGYSRGHLITFAAPPKGNKTFAATFLGYNALKQGKRVMHVSHEMKLEEIEMRYDMCIGALTNLARSNEMKIIKGKRYASVFNVSEVIKQRKKFRKFGGDLNLQVYPQKTCRIADLKLYLERYKMETGNIPDVLISDYADIMAEEKWCHGDPRAHADFVYQGLVQIAKEYNILVVTCSQCGRQAFKRAIVHPEDISEDIRKVAHTDMAFFIGKTKDMVLKNKCCLNVGINRHGRDRFAIELDQALHVGRFAMGAGKLMKEKKEEENE